MFESLFRRIGKFSVKNAKKILVFWIVLFIIMVPLSTIFLNETSYDLSKSIVPANSMANMADTVLAAQFPDSSGSNTTGIVIVTNNTNVNNPAEMAQLVNLQNDLHSYLDSTKASTGYENITSILTLENSTLQNFSAGMKAELNGTYAMVSGANAGITLLNQSAAGVAQTIFEVPLLFLQNFTTNYFSNNYNYTISNEFAYEYIVNSSLMNNSLVQLYFPILYDIWSSYGSSVDFSNPSIATTIMSSAINDTVNSTSWKSYLGTQLQLYDLSVVLVDNLTLNNFSINSTWQKFMLNYSVQEVGGPLAGNSTSNSFITNVLNISVRSFIWNAYNLSQPAVPTQILNLAAYEVAHGIEKSLEYNPLLSVNMNTLQNYLMALNDTKNVKNYVDSVLSNEGFDTYPVVPTSYVFHQFVGYDNSTTIIMLSFKYNTSAQTVSEITSIADNYSKTIPNSNYYVAGSSALDKQLGEESISGMVRALIIGIVLSVIIVGVFFRSPVAAFIPLSIFGLSAVISMGVNGLLYRYVFRTTISFITPTLLLILILGLTSDYIVYIMSRYRNERRKGNPEAVIDAAQWAGHAVFTSGVTVALSYLILWISNVPIFSDSGLTNLIGVTISISLANTFLISLISLSKDKIFWPSKTVEGSPLPFEKSMTSISRTVLKHKRAIVVVFMVASFIAGYLYYVTPTSMDVFKLVPESSGIQAMVAVNGSFHGDFFGRGYVILEFPSDVVSNGNYNLAEMNTTTSVENALMNTSGISQVYGPTYPFGDYISPTLNGIPLSAQSDYKSQMNSYIGNDSRYVMISFQLSDISWGQSSSNVVNSLNNVISTSTSNSHLTNYYIGGITQGLNDAYSYTSSTFAKIIPILAIVILFVLLIQLSSLFTPIRLILMVLASVIIALSLAYVVLYYIFHLPLLIFLPMFTVITLLAVGLDYDIFMVTRVREAVFKGETDEKAIQISIQENGGVIITLGLLLFATFISLYFSNIGIMQEMGLGLGLGVLIDTFVSWPFFVPAIMLYLKKYNWWPSKMKMKEE